MKIHFEATIIEQVETSFELTDEELAEYEALGGEPEQRDYLDGLVREEAFDVDTYLRDVDRVDWRVEEDT